MAETKQIKERLKLFPDLDYEFVKIEGEGETAELIEVSVMSSNEADCVGVYQDESFRRGSVHLWHQEPRNASNVRYQFE